MELLSARWEDFDLEGKVWKLSKECTKTGVEIEIPLGEIEALVNEVQV